MKKLRHRSKKLSNVEKRVSKKELNKITGGSTQSDYDWDEDRRRREQDEYNNTYYKD